MTGSKQSAQPTRPLQTHTCFDYEGGIAVDHGVTTGGVAKGSLRFPSFGVCVVGTGVGAGSSVTLTSCGASRLKAVTMGKDGQIKPIASSALCLTAGTTTVQGVAGARSTSSALSRGSLAARVQLAPRRGADPRLAPVAAAFADWWQVNLLPSSADAIENEGRGL